MTLVNSTIDVTPVNTATQIVPSSNPTLTSPYNESATCDTAPATPVLNFLCTVDIPKEIEWSKVNVLQYYNPENSDTIEIYFVYDVTGNPTEFSSYSVNVTANATDADGHEIPLADITSVVSLVEDVDPKTSRGTTITVRHTGGI